MTDNDGSLGFSDLDLLCLSIPRQLPLYDLWSRVNEPKLSNDKFKRLLMTSTVGEKSTATQ